MIPKNVQMPNPNPKYKPPGTPTGGREGNTMKKCYDHEECEYNAQPDCVLPEGAQCPHGEPGTNPDGVCLATMAQESLDNAMEMIDNCPEQTNCWIPFYIGIAWAY